MEWIVATPTVTTPPRQVGPAVEGPTEKHLAAAACSGDPTAFSALVSRYGRPIYSVCRRYLGPEDAEDAAQETFVRAFVHIGNFDPERPLMPWLVTIARRLCIDALRKRRPSPQGAMAQETSPASDLESLVSAKEEIGILKQGLSELPEGPREAVWLYHFEGMAYRDIAQALEVPQGTVMTWLHRGRNRLRELVEGGGTPGNPREPQGNPRGAPTPLPEKAPGVHNEGKG